MDPLKQSVAVESEILEVDAMVEDLGSIEELTHDKGDKEPEPALCTVVWGS